MSKEAGVRYRADRKAWIAQISYRGVRVSRLCHTKKAAREARAELLLELKGQARSVEEAGDRPATLRLLCEAYLCDLEARGKAADSITRARDTAKRLTEFFGQRMEESLHKTREADLYAFREARLNGGVKRSTINRDLRTIRAMLKKGIPGFRFPNGLLFREDETRIRWLEPVQEVDVMSRLRSPFHEIARLACLTLMRLSEVRTLTREQVALSQGVISIPRSKTGPNVVVLSGEAMDLLRKHLDSHASSWVFPAPHGRPYSRVHVSRQWRLAVRQAGLGDFHFHDLRHHGATMALNAGFSTPILMALGRWRTERMVRRYAAVTDKTLRAAAQAVAGNTRPTATTDCNQVANLSPTLARP